MLLKLVRSSLLVLLSLPLAAQHDMDGDGLETILIPVTTPASQQSPGAHGSLWATQLWVSNLSEHPVWYLQANRWCPPMVTCEPDVPPGSAIQLSLASNHTAALMYVPEEASAGFSASARLLELSKTAQPTGVDLPIVREREFLRGSSRLLAVPAGTATRATLRLYDPRLEPTNAVSVMFSDVNGTVLATTRMDTGADPYARDYGNDPNPYGPSVATIFDLAAAFPILATVDRFHITITPDDQAKEYWAFVSVTHDETQHVLIIKPN